MKFFSVFHLEHTNCLTTTIMKKKDEKDMFLKGPGLANLFMGSNGFKNFTQKRLVLSKGSFKTLFIFSTLKWALIITLYI